MVVRSLKAHGVELVFGIPGTHNLELYAHLDRHGIRHVSPRHEQGAGYAADGYARASGRPGVAITTAGPALMNIAAAAGQAQSDSVPLLVVAPGMPRAHPSASSGYLHEMPSQQRAMEGVVERSVRVMSHAELGRELADAFAAFRSRRPRARYVEVPLDLLAEAAEADVPIAAEVERARAAGASVTAAARAARVREAGPRDHRRRRRGGRGGGAARARRAARRARDHDRERQGRDPGRPPARARREAQLRRRPRVAGVVRRRARGRDRAGGVRRLGPAAGAAQGSCASTSTPRRRTRTRSPPSP